MQPKPMAWIIILVVALDAAILYGCYSAGRRAERTEHAAALALIESELVNTRFNTDRSMEQLRASMVESEGRIDRLADGLGSAVDLASRTTDRSRRIAILVAGIDEALRGIRGIKDD